MWWTSGERDDVFWRSSQSGGRATQRRKFGKSTYGSEGDIAAVDPIGTPLLEFTTIELKRGSSIGCAGDLIDMRDSDAIRPFEAAIKQAIEAHKAANSFGWMLICKRDHRIPMVYAERRLLAKLFATRQAFFPSVDFDIHINCEKNQCLRVRFVAISLDNFLARVSPTMIINASKKP
jgi:hypothetical protein